MRALFILALLSNVVLFAYLQWISPVGDPPPQPPYPGDGSLVLLDEETQEAAGQVDDTAPAAPVEPEAQSVPQAPVAACYRSPAYDSEQAARAAMARDAGDALRSEVRQETVNVDLGYWVYLGPGDSREAAEERLAALAEAGVEDVVVVTEAPYTNAISLGVFSNPERAERHREDIEALGFDAESGPRQRREDRYYVFAEWARPPSVRPSGWRAVDCHR